MTGSAAVELAVQYVNTHPDLLPNTKLTTLTNITTNMLLDLQYIKNSKSHFILPIMIMLYTNLQCLCFLHLNKLSIIHYSYFLIHNIGKVIPSLNKLICKHENQSIQCHFILSSQNTFIDMIFKAQYHDCSCYN